MRRYYLAVDIGASSGRHILAYFENGKIHLEEVYRFENGMKNVQGHLCWDTEHLFEEIINGLSRCGALGRIPCSMGIDTWAVDYALLDQDGRVIGNTYGYRDHRTDGMDQKVYKVISKEKLYERTGIQKQIFNTIYQLMAVKEKSPEDLKKAKHMLLIPDYFNYRLTSVMKTEYTNATTTQLVNQKTKTWDMELIDLLGYPRDLFGTITPPGTVVGHLTPEIREKVGFDVEVVQVATHDTASAVLAVPAQDKDFLYVSSGTWSLIGVEQAEANCSPESRLANLTNEGGFAYRFRFLKNIMGLWMIQSVRHEWNDKYSFAEICDMASECAQIPSLVDVNDSMFLSPSSMIQAIKDFCKATNQKIPEKEGEIAAVIYHSLAQSYAEAAKEIESITGKRYGSIHIVGGGANADYLNQLTADATGKTVYSGPTEATAIGNIAAQMLNAKKFETPEEARKVIFNSFPIKTFKPADKRSI